jgi:hypothetical protein
VCRQRLDTGVICEQGPHVVTGIRRKWGCKKRSRDVDLIAKSILTYKEHAQHSLALSKLHLAPKSQNACKAMSKVSKARLRPGAGGLGRPKPRIRLLL